jgi:hypothetical protein
LKAGLTYRAISVIAKCSHGSVHSEVLAVRKEQAALKLRSEEINKTENLAEANQSATVLFPTLDPDESEAKI